ncbi:MAG TPA: HD domain-containing phosphohydrolase [Gemmatimonadota bacterium]|nr:HD domain-containing phosphohydrolase [Gemmatimonadota bacterium]
MALQVGEGGTTSSLEFIPQLAGAMLLGPAGAAGLGLLTELFSTLFAHRKPLHKRVFNVAQMTLAITLAALAYRTFGGMISLESFDLTQVVAPFLLAVIVYFGVNTTLVSYVVAESQGEPITEIWGKIAGGLIAFDIAMSFIALVVAILYASFGPIVILFAIIPLFGLRYSYGVNIELQRLNSDLLRLMVKTIEAQDPYTSGHSIRVSEAAREIGKLIGIKRRDMRNLETAALLHDIGKIDVAYSEILRQEGGLSDEQRELIRDHPRRGVEIVKSIRSIPPQVLANIRHHHERWDGKGYPEGLAGEEIPIGARIIMVCDTVDAMTTVRPYRGALPLSVVREELDKHAGAQFDADIVKRVLDSDVLERLYGDSEGERAAAAAKGPGASTMRVS